MVNLPFFTSCAATLAKADKALFAWLRLISAASAMNSAMLVLVMALTTFVFFALFLL